MSTAFDPNRFRQALGCFPTGVTIITARGGDGGDVGVTANSFNSVSLDPPMVLWSIGKASTKIAAFLTATHFAVHVLALDQEPLARRFATRGIDRFAGLSPARGLGGVALLDGCAARFECRLAFQYQGGDHVILVGEVLTFDSSEREPLVFSKGCFASAVPRSGSFASQ
ncbi:NADH-FMN oxidoreductase RutF, flavin reductase (DIM6/NTAB) family [Solimonas aquatica]|uniref:NADH-FMN oxidoreductase RutF, flavin reductase (DIM6/NTAB) family n=1 Tax=Solimonas aquatica TaxID=489703 RepID=A0A1H9KCL1_9GAMM|nr:flavin reductase family protein [Solimonas aquatica]SEQ96677.1 NADH-FMN oxidoreductase RutF, flavin reductase (DIM6/NTAB) family [Solimonas aquatica]